MQSRAQGGTAKRIFVVKSLGISFTVEIAAVADYLTKTRRKCAVDNEDSFIRTAVPPNTRVGDRRRFAVLIRLALPCKMTVWNANSATRCRDAIRLYRGAVQRRYTED